MCVCVCVCIYFPPCVCPSIPYFFPLSFFLGQIILLGTGQYAQNRHINFHHCLDPSNNMEQSQLHGKLPHGSPHFGHPSKGDHDSDFYHVDNLGQLLDITWVGLHSVCGLLSKHGITSLVFLLLLLLFRDVLAQFSMCQSTNELEHCRGLRQHWTMLLLHQMRDLRPMKWSDLPQDMHVWSETETLACASSPTPCHSPCLVACRLPLWVRLPHPSLPTGVHINCSLTVLNHRHSW